MLEPVNVPGTSHEYSNWTRRMTESARQIFARAEVRELCAAMRIARGG
jgi:4-alpha-glucanotransferase